LLREDLSLFRSKNRILELSLFPIWRHVLGALVLMGCQGDLPEGSVRLDLESRRPRRVAEFYLGAYGTASEVEGALSGSAGVSLRMDSVQIFAPSLAASLRPSAEDGLITREELAKAVSATYAQAIGAPDQIEEFQRVARFSSDDDDWMRHEVSGSMTRYRRRLSIRRAAVRSALAGVADGARGLTYDVGTVIVGEHLEGPRVVETTAMIKRRDGFWDYYAYDSTGTRVNSISGTPDPLQVPVDCFGCHYGTRLFEPERSFPGSVGPGPFGERGVWVGDASRHEKAAVYLDEHRRRTDGLLGLYGTLYLSGLMEQKARGTPLDSLDARLLRSLVGPSGS
jgi:hypothetical protein